MKIKGKQRKTEQSNSGSKTQFDETTIFLWSESDLRKWEKEFLDTVKKSESKIKKSSNESTDCLLCGIIVKWIKGKAMGEEKWL